MNRAQLHTKHSSMSSNFKIHSPCHTFQSYLRPTLFAPHKNICFFYKKSPVNLFNLFNWLNVVFVGTDQMFIFAFSKPEVLLKTPPLVEKFVALEIIIKISTNPLIKTITRARFPSSDPCAWNKRRTVLPKRDFSDGVGPCYC